MRHAVFMGMGMLIATTAMLGCSQRDRDAKKDRQPVAKNKDRDKDGSDHVHGNGPSGGITFGLGKHHVELTVDHPAKEITILFLKEVSGKKEKDWPPEPVAAKEFTLVTKETKVKEGAAKGKTVSAMTIKLLPKNAAEGRASRFVGSDPGLGNVADFEGSIFGEIDGRPSKGVFKEE